MTRFISFISGKECLGKTFLRENLAFLLRKKGKKVFSCHLEELRNKKFLEKLGVKKANFEEIFEHLMGKYDFVLVESNSQHPLFSRLIEESDEVIPIINSNKKAFEEMEKVLSLIEGKSFIHSPVINLWHKSFGMIDKIGEKPVLFYLPYCQKIRNNLLIVEEEPNSLVSKKIKEIFELIF